MPFGQPSHFRAESDQPSPTREFDQIAHAMRDGRVTVQAVQENANVTGIGRAVEPPVEEQIRSEERLIFMV